jgi:hypothetical protein
MAQPLDANDQAFLKWERDTDSYEWNHQRIGVHSHDVLMMLYSTSHGVRPLVASMEEELVGALKFESPILTNRLESASFDCQLVYVPKILHVIMEGDQEAHPRLFTILDRILPSLKEKIDTMTSREKGFTWSTEDHFEHFRRYNSSFAHFSNVQSDEHLQQVLNGVAVLLHKHGFSTGERPEFPFPEVPAWLPENLKQSGTSAAPQAKHG